MVCEKGTTTPLEARLVQVGFGKYYKFYLDPRDIDAQYLEVRMFKLLPNFFLNSHI